MKKYSTEMCLLTSELLSVAGGHTDRDGMREGSGNVADVVSGFNTLLPR